MINEKFFRRKLTPFSIALTYAYIGGVSFFITTNAVTFIFSDPITQKRMETLNYWVFILITATLLYLLILSSERTITRAQKNLERVSRALKTRSGCNQALLRAADELELMQETCRIIIEDGGYRFAWVGMAQHDKDQTVLPVAKWGDDDGYLETDKISWGDNQWGQGPTGVAIRTQKDSKIQHYGIWLEQAQKRGFSSSVSFPLMEGSTCLGALAIYAEEADAFDTDEMALLRAMADDLSYGIVTLRLHSEKEKVKRERRQLATVLEQGTEGVLIFSPDGMVNYINPAFEQITGCNRDFLLNKPIEELIQEGRNKEFYRAIQKVLTDKTVRTDHLINKRRDGSLYAIVSRVMPVYDQEGEATSFATLIRDVSHETQLENQLRHAQKMEAIATLSGGIAHDFNNILASIITCSEMALDDLPLNAPIRKNIEVVLRAGHRGRELVRQIRSLSRQNEPEKKPIQMTTILDECIKLLRPSFPTSIEISCRIDPELGMVLADPTQMHQVIINLCTNAAHAMGSKGGKLTLSLFNVNLTEKSAAGFTDLQPGPYLRIMVRDTGHGIPTEILEHIFDPYFTTKGQGEGTGLGLSVTHGILKNHGGTILVNSEPGKGAIFRIFLPRIVSIPETEEAVQHTNLQAVKARILFVDDEEDIVFATGNLLRKLGYEVTATSKAEEALNLFRQAPDNFDLVITDLTMPFMTGECLAEEIQSIRKGLPIILCTGFGPSFRNLASENGTPTSGIREVIQKPFDKAEIAQAIQRVLLPVSATV
ncbi:MAG: ATP-binding protein [Desulfuromonadaceae bacterium]